ncbi:MAG: hypothetical protein J6Z34_03650 [Clostridia bacterium]|nr:hypothetical protein [Clostridia bacterium]
MNTEEKKILDNNLKWFNAYLYIPAVFSLINFLAAFIFGIVRYKRTNNPEWILWGTLIGAAVGALIYLVLKVIFSFMILHILYLKDISEKNNGRLSSDADDEEEEAEDLYEKTKTRYYNFTPADGTYAVSAAMKNMPENVIVPSDFMGKKVTAVLTRGFYGRESIVSAGISNCVVKIGDNAFSGCTGLKEILFGGTVSEWESIEKGIGWDNNTGDYKVYCLNGAVDKSGNVPA